MIKFSILKYTDVYLLNNFNDDTMYIIGLFLESELSGGMGEVYKEWLQETDPRADITTGNICELRKANGKIILHQQVFRGEEGYDDPDFIPPTKFETTSKDLIRIIDEWYELKNREPRPEKIMISQEGDEPVKLTALTSESSYYHLQPPSYEPPSYKLPEEKFIIIGVGKDNYYWYGEANYHGMAILAILFIEDIMEFGEKMIEFYKEGLLNPEDEEVISRNCRIDKFGNKVVLHREQERFNPAEAGEYFPYRLETTIDDMLKILDTWKNITELAHKPKKIRISQKGNQPVEFKLLYDK